MAAATPAMFPVPMVAANAVQSAWNCEMALWSVLLWECLEKSCRKVCWHQWRRWVIWKHPVAMVVSKPVPSSSTRPLQPQMKSLMTPLNSANLLRNCSMVFAWMTLPDNEKELPASGGG